MDKRKTIPAALAFLLGFIILTSASAQDCWDNDGDGAYDVACGGRDCDDSDPSVCSGDSRLGPGQCHNQVEMDALCGDGKDNDCDGKTDCEDEWCQVPPRLHNSIWFEIDGVWQQNETPGAYRCRCIRENRCCDRDGDGAYDVACGGRDCDDSDPSVCNGDSRLGPGPCHNQAEMGALCRDDKDNDCDGKPDCKDEWCHGITWMEEGIVNGKKISYNCKCAQTPGFSIKWYNKCCDVDGDGNYETCCGDMKLQEVEECDITAFRGSTCPEGTECKSCKCVGACPPEKPIYVRGQNSSDYLCCESDSPGVWREKKGFFDSELVRCCRKDEKVFTYPRHPKNLSICCSNTTLGIETKPNMRCCPYGNISIGPTGDCKPYSFVSICCDPEDIPYFTTYNDTYENKTYICNVPVACCKPEETYDYEKHECHESCCSDDRHCSSRCGKQVTSIFLGFMLFKGFWRKMIFTEHCNEGYCKEDKTKPILPKGASWLMREGCDEEISSDVDLCGRNVTRAHFSCEECGSHCVDNSVEYLKCADDKPECIRDHLKDCTSEGKVCIEHKKGSWKDGKLMSAACEDCPKSVNFVTNTLEHMVMEQDGMKYWTGWEKSYTSEATFVGAFTPEECFDIIKRICEVRKKRKCPGKLTVIFSNHGKPGIQGFSFFGLIRFDADYVKKIYDNDKYKGLKDCIGTIVYTGCSTGAGLKGKLLLDRTSTLLSDTAVAATGNVHPDYDSCEGKIRGDKPPISFTHGKEDPPFRTLQVRGNTVYFATESDSPYPGLDGDAYWVQTEGDIGSVEIAIRTDKDLIGALDEEKAFLTPSLCDFELVDRREFTVDSSTDVISIGNFEMRFPHGQVRDGTRITLTWLKADCSRFYEYNPSHFTPPDAEDVKIAHELMEAGVYTGEEYNEIVSMHRNGWECTRDEHCQGLNCPVSKVPCQHICVEHTCQLLERPCGQYCQRIPGDVAAPFGILDEWDLRALREMVHKPEITTSCADVSYQTDPTSACLVTQDDYSLLLSRIRPFRQQEIHCSGADMNGDGEINERDITTIQQLANARLSRTTDSNGRICGDLDGDGRVTKRDMDIVIRMVFLSRVKQD